MNQTIGTILGPVIGAIVGCLITWLVTRSGAKSDLGQRNQLLEGKLKGSTNRLSSLESRLKAAIIEKEKLKRFERKYSEVRERLEASSVVKDYFQPVILLGPRFVGKTSLLMQWHAPWDHGRLGATQSHKVSIVPIYDFEQGDTEPHFADPDIRTKVDVHLKLRVHDFPGELGAQEKVSEQAKLESERLRKESGKNLGIVLVCVFDSREAVQGLEQSTLSYYNGDLFANLRTMVSYRSIHIQRLVFVFNKYDLLQQECPNLDDTDLLKRCAEAFAPILSPLYGVCSPEKVCEVFTVLEREEIARNNRGAPIVLGEAARGLVEAIAGPGAVREVITEEATKYSARNFTS